MVAVARALVNHPSIVLADEPTGISIPDGEVKSWRFETLSRRGNIIVVTHEEDVAQHARRIIIRICDSLIAADEVNPDAAGRR